jgi:hypothetical protein
VSALPALGLSVGVTAGFAAVSFFVATRMARRAAA